MEAEIGWWEVATLGGAVLLYGAGNAIEVALLVSRKSQLLQWQQQGRSGAAAAYHMREAPGTLFEYGTYWHDRRKYAGGGGGRSPPHSLAHDPVAVC